MVVTTNLRDAAERDLPAITAIYNLAVERTTAIWNDRLVDVADRAAWLAERTGTGFPVIVAVDEADAAIGYATYGPFRPHDGFRHSVEHSVYVHESQRGRGLGSALMLAIIERARAEGRHAMIAGVDAGNAGSIALHERLGFERVGLLPQVGVKFGRWLDLAFLQLVLDDAPAR